MSFQIRLKEAREHKGYSLTKLAELLGVSRTEVCDYESGIITPKEKILFRIYEVLDVEPENLFQDNFSPIINTILEEQEIELLRLSRELNKEGFAKLLEHADFLTYLDKYLKSDIDL